MTKKNYFEAEIGQELTRLSNEIGTFHFRLWDTIKLF